MANSNENAELSIVEIVKNERQHLIAGKTNKTGSDGSENPKPVLFVSFDICDFTAYKATHTSNIWVKVINELIESDFKHFRLWKFNGDEVIFAGEVNSLTHMCLVINDAQTHLRALNHEIKDKLSDDVYAKAAVWLAMIDEEVGEETKNLALNRRDLNITDFVGQNLDEGFRLTKWSSWQKVVIDPKIVYAILKAIHIYESGTGNLPKGENKKFYEEISGARNNNGRYPENRTGNEIIEMFKDILKNTYKMGYARLKGVWNERMYPIFWYHVNKNDDDGRLSYKQNDVFEGQQMVMEVFKPGEFLNGKLINGADSDNDLSRIKTAHDNLREIFKEVQVNEMENILDCLVFEYKEYDYNEKKKINTRDARLYYMVVCVDKETQKALILKRGNKKKYLKGVWDFGNVQYVNMDMKNEMQKHYKNKFGIDITLVTDSERDGNIYPLGCCAVHRNNTVYTGILCCAAINTSGQNAADMLKEIKQKAKDDNYEDIRLVSADELKEFQKHELDEDYVELNPYGPLTAGKLDKEYSCIPYFTNSIKRAIEKVCEGQKEAKSSE